MGIKFSSKKDYNRVLAKQPRTSIMIPSFNPPKRLQKKLDSKSLTIPAPVRLSRTNKYDEDSIDDATRKSTVENHPIQLTQPLVQEIESSPPINPKNSFPVSDKTIETKSSVEPLQQQITTRKSSLAIQSNRHSPVDQHATTGDAVIIARTIIQTEQQQTNNHIPLPFQSSSTIIEHHGKQFLTELKKRTERRCVQYFDEETHKTRFFEVVDSIPYRVIRPFNQKIQSRSQSVSTLAPQSNQSTLLPSSSIDQLNQPLIYSHNSYDWSNRQSSLSTGFNNRYQQRPPLPPPPPSPPTISINKSYSSIARSTTSKDQLNTNPLLNSMNNSNSIVISEPLPNNFTSQYNKSNERIYDQASSNQQHFSPTSRTSTSSVKTSRSSKSTINGPVNYHSKPINGYNRYSSNPLSFRKHTPTISSGSTSTMTTDSFDSDEQTESSDQSAIDEILQSNQGFESYDHINQLPFYDRNSGYQSSALFDQFNQPLNVNFHYSYRKRPSFQNYDEPVKNRIVPRPSQHDYAPIRYNIQQSSYY